MKRRGVKGKLKPKVREASRAIVARVMGAAVDIWEAPYLSKGSGRRLKRTAKRESRRAVRRSARYEIRAGTGEWHDDRFWGLFGLSFPDVRCGRCDFIECACETLAYFYERTRREIRHEEHHGRAAA